MTYDPDCAHEQHLALLDDVRSTFESLYREGIREPLLHAVVAARHPGLDPSSYAYCADAALVGLGVKGSAPRSPSR